MRGSFRLLTVVAAAIVLLFVLAIIASADSPANEHFQRIWARTDQQVRDGSVARTWIWGPDAFTGALQEPYSDTPGGQRTVQYFDKSRMEINHPDADPASPFYVTNGLLVVELMSGQLQTGDDDFEVHDPATVNVAGDADDANGPTYADLAPLRAAPPLADGAVITQRIDGTGVITVDESLAGQNVTAAYRLTVPGIDHQVASPFWTFLNVTGPVIVNGQAVTERLFEPWFYATGYPITEAYWADVKVAGTVRLVLLQCFERRCLTYTPGNPAGFLTEAGNVGQHYHTWRYEQIPNEDNPTATTTATATETAEPTATETATSTATEEPSGEYEYVTGWGEAFVPITPLSSPSDVSLDNDGNLWVADIFNDRFVVFDKHGLYLRTLGAHGTGVGQFDQPWGAAFSDDGRAFLLDSVNRNVQVFNADGVYQYQWGTPGTGNGQFSSPMAIAIHNNVVYVADTGNNRVQMFDLQGVYQGQFGSGGDGSGQFEYPTGIAFDAQSNIYVADLFNNRVQKFNSTGAYLSQFGSFGHGDGQFDLASHVAIDGDGFIYVTDRQNARVQKFNPNGSHVTQWGSEGSAHGQFDYPQGITIDEDGNVYVADSDNNRIQKFTSDGAFLYQITDNRRSHFNIPTDITTDQNGNLLVTDAFVDPQTISRYALDGDPLDDFLIGNGLGDHDLPYGAAVSETGDIYLIDAYANRVLRYSSNWTYLAMWGTAGTGPGQFTGAHDIAIDADNNVYVTDSGNNRVQKFDANGVFLDQWGGVGDANGQFNDPESIAIDGERVYVTDYNNNRVQVFERDGDYIEQWGSPGSGVGELNGPIGIAVSPDGYVLVVENGNNRVQVFTPSGESLSTFGTQGSGAGQFNGPLAVTVDADGNAYVTEVGNHRIQKFAPAP